MAGLRVKSAPSTRRTWCARVGLIVSCGLAAAALASEIRAAGANLTKGCVEIARVGLVIDVERVVSVKPSLLLAGSTSSSTLAVIRSAGVPVVANSEWLESTALGRAEWLKYLALFLNEERKAQSIYSAM